MNHGDVRRLALALPGAVEADHHGRPSFRVAQRIFATLPDALHLHVMLAPEEADEAIARAPAALAPLFWGARLAGVRVRLAAVQAVRVEELLRDAWRRRAPARLQKPC